MTTELAYWHCCLGITGFKQATEHAKLMMLCNTARCKIITPKVYQLGSGCSASMMQQQCKCQTFSLIMQKIFFLSKSIESVWTMKTKNGKCMNNAAAIREIFQGYKQLCSPHLKRWRGSSSLVSS